MTITIPMWLLWVIGVPVGLFLLLAAAFGVFAMIWMWRERDWPI